MRAARLVILGLVGLGFLATAHADRIEPGQICCFLEAGSGIEEVNQRWGTTTLAAHPEADFYLLHIDGVEDIEAFAEQMSGDPAVTTSGANYHIESPEGVRMMVIPAVGGGWEDYQDQGLTERIGLDEAHLMSRGSGVLVAVLDTGIDPEHIAFAGRLSPEGYDFIDDDAEPWETANGQDDDGDGVIDEGFAHGSMVAGIVALVAPEATILPIRVLNDEGRGSVYSVTRGILHAREQGADVCNMSFGIPLLVPSLWPELQEAAAAGVILVGGAGNEDREDPPYYPAFDPLVYMVTAVDSEDIKAEFADFHDEVLVCAPGVGVRSAYPGNDWGIGSGCSFATPFVSGEVALILDLTSHLADGDGDDDAGSRAEIEERIHDAVDDIYDLPGNGAYEEMLGGGRVFLPAALEDLYDQGMGIPEDGLGNGFLTAWPNPATGVVRFRSTSRWGAQAPVRLTVMDAAGRVIRTLPLPRTGVAEWDGRSPAGRMVPSGHYWVRARTPAGSEVLRLTVLH